VRYAELGIKSDQTRKMWLRQLRDNVVRCLAWDDIPYSRVKIVQGRLIVYTRDGSAPACLRRVFGVASVSPAVELPSDMERIKKEALSLFHARAPKSFRVTSQRVTKDFPLTSQQINEQVGEAVYGAGGTVRLTAYELNIRIEIIHGRAYVFSSALQGVGGLPLGTQQRGCAVVETERDVLAALLFMRRGCPVELVVLDTNQAGQYLSSPWTPPAVVFPLPVSLIRKTRRRGARAVHLPRRRHEGGGERRTPRLCRGHAQSLPVRAL
jgi:thiamine biosynthesis protein ThiI